MADKVKKRKTVGRGSGSQTRNLKYNPDMFRSFGCEKFHGSIPKNAKFIEEKALLIGPGDFEEISQNISNRGWDQYVRHPRVASRELVFEFFSNIFPRPGDEALKFPDSTSYVRGHDVPFNAATINRIFGLAPVDTPDCLLRNKISKKRVKEDPARAAEIRATLCKPGKDWVRNASGEPQNILVKDLTPVARGWANFISHTMCPSSNHSELSFDKANLASCIMRGEPINLGWLLEKEIKEIAEFKKGVPSYWKYASLVALLCEEVGVVAGPDEKTVKPGAAITSGWICARAGVEQPAHMEVPHQEDPSQREEYQQEQPDEQEPTFNLDDFPVGPSVADFQRLEARMDVLAANQERMEYSQIRMAEEQRLGMRALYRAICTLQSGGQLDPEADIFQEPPPQ